MPLINGCKYSCEPCIRGHRATSCAHTDRILIEVRKPGRPLESCGHNLNTCQCGRLAESFIVGDVLPSPTASQQGGETDLGFIVTTPPPATASSRTTSRSGGKSKVSKRTSRKKADVSSSSSPRNRGSREASALIDENVETEAFDTNTTASSPSVQEPGYVFQQPQSAFQGQPFQQGVQYFPSMGGGQYQPMQNEYTNYQGIASYGPSPGIQYPYGSPQQYQSPSPSYSSRIEDVRRSGGPQEEGDTTEVSSQYIVATPDSVWRATS